MQLLKLSSGAGCVNVRLSKSGLRETQLMSSEGRLGETRRISFETVESFEQTRHLS